MKNWTPLAVAMLLAFSPLCGGCGKQRDTAPFLGKWRGPMFDKGPDEIALELRDDHSGFLVMWKGEKDEEGKRTVWIAGYVSWEVEQPGISLSGAVHGSASLIEDGSKLQFSWGSPKHLNIPAGKTILERD